VPATTTCTSASASTSATHVAHHTGCIVRSCIQRV
jgi:hypothetical protein